MNLLVVVSEFPKLTETFVYRNIAEYRRLGHRVSLFHVKPFRSDEILHEFAREIATDAFTFGYLDPSTLSGLIGEGLRRPGVVAGLSGEIIRAHLAQPKRGAIAMGVLPKGVALGRWCRENGIEHIHAEFAGFPATVAMIAGRVSGVPFSFSAHANDIFVSQALLPEKARAAAFVRTISDYNVDFLSKLDGFPEDRLRVIRCGVDASLLRAELPAPPGDGPLRILYVGSLIEKKGVEHLVRAVARLQGSVPMQCRIVGRGDLSEPLKQTVHALGLDDVIRFDGPQEAAGVRAAYDWAHVVVVPSVQGPNGRAEGIPVVAMEALALGRPVIASALSGIPELIEQGVTGFLVPPGDPESIAAALAQIHGNWDAASAAGLRGRERIRSEYLVERNAAELAAAMAG